VAQTTASLRDVLPLIAKPNLPRMEEGATNNSQSTKHERMREPERYACRLPRPVGAIRATTGRRTSTPCAAIQANYQASLTGPMAHSERLAPGHNDLGQWARAHLTVAGRGFAEVRRQRNRACGPYPACSVSSPLARRPRQGWSGSCYAHRTLVVGITANPWMSTPWVAPVPKLSIVPP
jgi:hypothetical protein